MQHHNIATALTNDLHAVTHRLQKKIFRQYTALSIIIIMEKLQIKHKPAITQPVDEKHIF